MLLFMAVLVAADSHPFFVSLLAGVIRGALRSRCAGSDNQHLYHHRRVPRRRERLFDRASIVGLPTDELAEQTKGSRPGISRVERIAILQSVRYGD